MATRLSKIVGGEKGYVPVKSNSHGGVDVTKAYNEDYVLENISMPPEFGYAQVTKKAEWPASETGEYWIEKSHLAPFLDEPDPVVEGEGKDFEVLAERWETGGKRILTLKEL
jgi:hypothetical protein